MNKKICNLLTLCGLFTATHMTTAMEPEEKEEVWGTLMLSSQSGRETNSSRYDFDNTYSMVGCDIKTSPQLSPRKSQSRSGSISPRDDYDDTDSLAHSPKQQISEVLGGEKQSQQNDTLKRRLSFTNKPNISVDYDYVNSRNIQGTSQSQLTFKSKDGKETTLIAECEGDYKQEKFLILEEQHGDSVIKRAINMNLEKLEPQQNPFIELLLKGPQRGAAVACFTNFIPTDTPCYLGLIIERINDTLSEITYQNGNEERSIITALSDNSENGNYIAVVENIEGLLREYAIDINQNQSQEMTLEEFKKIQGSIEEKYENLKHSLNDKAIEKVEHILNAKDPSEINIAIIKPQLDETEKTEKTVNQNFRKRAQQAKATISFIRRAINVSAFAAIIITILYNHKKLSDAFINALNKILPHGYAL